ncbi:hypothetical protein [Streptomyces sparsogenes]|uniref:Uncharacterized protein n=1 Tax=Streptomyces sparsogenes DSM 40356 TaxID=1331668 RepID=A0A1R1SL20_9ACTN|nr:hypothetical protein [Streptomyces sparsogenes]OMI38970.1 hypothetical protein SPAR_13325 [Streptomyces sparsogenes DSM 40356]
MDEEPITIKLSRDQAFVLSDWLYKVMFKSDELSAIVKDPAVWSPIHAISGTLDKALVEIFMPDYEARLSAAKRRLLDSMGSEDDELREVNDPDPASAWSSSHFASVPCPVGLAAR